MGRCPVRPPDRLLDWAIMRIVSLLPSATEIVYALGLGGQLAGVTFECDEPASARTDKTVVVGGRDTAGMTPAAIDAYVRSQLAAGEDLYTLHADALAGLAPDLILTQDLCRVCALPAGTSRTRSTISAAPPRSSPWIHTASTTSSRRSRPWASAPAPSGRRSSWWPRSGGGARRRPSGAVIEWTDPPFTAGHWVPDLIPAAGGRPVAARPGGRSEQTTWDQIAAARPEVVVVAPCGFQLDASSAQAPASSTASRRSPPSSTPTQKTLRSPGGTPAASPSPGVEAAALAII